MNSAQRFAPVFHRTCSVIIGPLLLTASAMTIAAQEPPTSPTLPSQTETAIHIDDKVRRAPGKLIAQGKNTTPFGTLKVKTYLLEEVELPNPITIQATPVEPQIRIEHAYRLTIAVEDLTRGGPYVIQLGEDIVFDSVREHADGKSLSVMIYGLGILEDGASITLAEGWGCNLRNHTTLPERLELPEQVKKLNAREPDPGNYVKSIRLRSPEPGWPQPFIEITLATTAKFTARNETMVLQIGDREFPGGANELPGTLVFRILEKRFQEAPDGGRIKVKYGLCSSGGIVFGRLNKSMLER